MYQDERGRAVIRLFESHSLPLRPKTRSRQWTNIIVAMIGRGCLWPSLRCNTFETYNLSNPVLWGECLQAADMFFSLSHQNKGAGEWVEELKGRLECKDINAKKSTPQLIGWVKDFPSAWYFLKAGQLFENPILAKLRWNKSSSGRVVRIPRGTCPYCKGSIGNDWHSHLMACQNYVLQVKQRLDWQRQSLAKIFPTASLQQIPDDQRKRHPDGRTSHTNVKRRR